MNSNPVRHNVPAQRYELELDDGQLAVAEYARTADGALVFNHTFVPPEFRGQGLAEKLVRYALEDARAQKAKIIPACSYVALFARRHPEYQSLLK